MVSGGVLFALFGVVVLKVSEGVVLMVSGCQKIGMNLYRFVGLFRVFGGSVFVVLGVLDCFVWGG